MKPYRTLLCFGLLISSLATSGCGLRISPEFGFNCWVVCFGEEKDNSSGGFGGLL